MPPVARHRGTPHNLSGAHCRGDRQHAPKPCCPRSRSLCRGWRGIVELRAHETEPRSVAPFAGPTCCPRLHIRLSQMRVASNAPQAAGGSNRGRRVLVRRSTGARRLTVARARDPRLAHLHRRAAALRCAFACACAAWPRRGSPWMRLAPRCRDGGGAETRRFLVARAGGWSPSGGRVGPHGASHDVSLCLLLCLCLSRVVVGHRDALARSR